MILPWSVYSVKEYDLPKLDSIMEAEMELCSGHSGVLFVVLISAIFSFAMAHSDLFSDQVCDSELNSKIPGTVH